MNWQKLVRPFFQGTFCSQSTVEFGINVWSVFKFLWSKLDISYIYSHRHEVKFYNQVVLSILFLFPFSCFEFERIYIVVSCFILLFNYWFFLLLNIFNWEKYIKKVINISFFLYIKCLIYVNLKSYTYNLSLINIDRSSKNVLNHQPYIYTSKITIK